MIAGGPGKIRRLDQTLPGRIPLYAHQQHSVLYKDWANWTVKLIEWNILHFRQQCAIRLFFV